MAESENLIRKISQAWPVKTWHSSRILVAVSGGADSTALLRALLVLRYDRSRTWVVHYNHAMRGAESDADEQFVSEMARGFDLPFLSERRSNHRDQAHVSEASLREDRYAFFRRIAAETQANYLVLGHHADDQVETFVHRLLRGTGPRGLCGMSTMEHWLPHVTIVRPMLRCWRTEIMDYLFRQEFQFRIDPSNSSSDYTRNKIRNELLPVLRSFSGSADLDSRLLQSMEMLREQQDLIDGMVDELLRSSDGYLAANRFEISIPAITSVSWPVQQQTLVRVWHQLNWPLREMSYSHWDRVRDLIVRSTHDPHPKRLELPSHVRMEIRGQRLTIERKQPES